MERPIFFALDKNEKIPQSYEKVQKNFKISGKIWKMITILQSKILPVLPTTMPLLFTHIIHFWKSLFIFTKYMTIFFQLITFFWMFMFVHQILEKVTNRYILMSVRLWNFKDGGYKNARFLLKNQHAQRKLF